MEVFFNLKAGSSLFVLSKTVLSTFLCGSFDLPCLECHPSCDCTTPGVCDTCKAGADAELILNAAACQCVDGMGNYALFIPTYHDQCGTCADQCATCYSNESTDCYTCKVSSATIPEKIKGYGRCVCADGYLLNYDVTAESDCVPCVPAGCPFCVGPTEADCYAAKETMILAYLGPAIYALPDTSSSHICYRVSLNFPPDCGTSILEKIMGPLEVEGGLYKPTPQQCTQLINAIWPNYEYWFSQVYPTFDPPIEKFSKAHYKTYLMMIMVQFSVSALLNDADWAVLVAAFNAPSESWANYFFWGGPNLGYTLDGGITDLEYPPTLKAWLQFYCPEEGFCLDLFGLVIGSPICNVPNCRWKSTCALVMPEGLCATT